MDYFCRGLEDFNVLDYLDDLIVISDTLQNHLEGNQLVLKHIKQFTLRANLERCFFVCDCSLSRLRD